MDKVGTLPVVGMGCTEAVGSDSYACTIIWVAPNFKQFQYKHDTAKLVEGSGMSEHQVYEYEPNPNAAVYTAKMSRRVADKGLNRYHNQGVPVIVDYRRTYRDPSF